MKLISSAKLLTGILLIAVCICEEYASGLTNETFFDHSLFNRFLGRFVVAGRVNYAGAKIESSDLNTYLLKIASEPKSKVFSMKEPEQIAFYINAYNAITIKTILDHYPIHGSLLNFLYPQNSIRQIKNAWSEKHTVHGEPLSLDDIEHNILRKKYREPRIHLALVCAAMSCPPIRNEAYRGELLDKQLNDQATKFLNSPYGTRYDAASKTLYISSIFKWYGDDFVGAYKNSLDLKGYPPKETAVLNFIYRFLKEPIQKAIISSKVKVKYLKYDWTLNQIPLPAN
ncbi:MAG: DUF547 domain-containing protein [Candidatus Dadabacteria bacterium]|nr:MAG: DUF547 domain-containing protein [Candidatus Dadabacteria bacterium]